MLNSLGQPTEAQSARKDCENFLVGLLRRAASVDDGHALRLAFRDRQVSLAHPREERASLLLKAILIVGPAGTL